MGGGELVEDSELVAALLLVVKWSRVEARGEEEEEEERHLVAGEKADEGATKEMVVARML